LKHCKTIVDLKEEDLNIRSQLEAFFLNLYNPFSRAVNERLNLLDEKVHVFLNLKRHNF